MLARFPTKTLVPATMEVGIVLGATHERTRRTVNTVNIYINIFKNDWISHAQNYRGTGGGGRPNPSSFHLLTHNSAVIKPIAMIVFAHNLHDSGINVQLWLQESFWNPVNFGPECRSLQMLEIVRLPHQRLLNGNGSCGQGRKGSGYAPSQLKRLGVRAYLQRSWKP